MQNRSVGIDLSKSTFYIAALRGELGSGAGSHSTLAEQCCDSVSQT